MMHIIIGLFFIALGIWGVFDEWYYVVDFVKGASAVILLAIGHIAILAGVMKPKQESEESPEAPDPVMPGLMPELKEDD